MVLIGWSDGRKTLVAEANIPQWLHRPQESTGFIMQGLERIEGWMKIQHSHPEWHEVRIALMRWDFTIQGNTWTILKHANGYEDEWQTHWELTEHIKGPAHGAYVDDLQWLTVERADQEFLDVSVRTVDGWRSPFDPTAENWLLPHGILLLETHKQWKKMLAYIVTQVWKPQLGDQLYRPLAIGQKGPGTIALEAGAKVDWQQAGASSTGQAFTGHQWWNENWTPASTWTAKDGSNFEVNDADDTTQPLEGLQSPAPWNVPAAKSAVNYHHLARACPSPEPLLGDQLGYPEWRG